MLKKIGIVALVGVMGLWLLGAVTMGMKRTNSLAGSYLNRWQTKVIDQVPLEDEIERVRGEITQLTPDMDKHIRDIAREKAQVEKLEKELTNGQTNLKQKKEEILAMTQALKSGTQQVSFNDQKYTPSYLAAKLDNELKSYERCEKDLLSREQLLQARKKGVEVAEDQLRTMRTKQRELETAVTQLEVELKTVRLEQNKCNFQLDDSRLAHINDSLTGIRERLRTDQFEVELRNQYADPAKASVENKTRSRDELINAVQKKFETSPETATVENK